jgi:hypothetical protein
VAVASSDIGGLDVAVNDAARMSIISARANWATIRAATSGSIGAFIRAAARRPQAV